MRDASVAPATMRRRPRTTYLTGWLRPRRLLFRVAVYCLLLGLSAFIVLPVGWMLTAALKPDLEPVFTATPEWFPSQFWHWENFRRSLIDTLPFLRYTLNTLLIVVGNILGVLI